MPLSEVRLGRDQPEIPRDVRVFLREAQRRIERFQRSSHVPAFVPSDFGQAYGILYQLTEANLTAGSLFCEWGSGFGVVACMAAMLDFDAVGIEIEDELVAEAQRLADDFELPVEFVRGSFIPRGGEVYASEHCWLHTEAGASGQELGLEPDDFDVIFAYPWPDEEGFTAKLFERYGGQGAVLVTYHGSEDFRLHRNMRRNVDRQRKCDPPRKKGKR